MVSYFSCPDIIWKKEDELEVQHKSVISIWSNLSNWRITVMCLEILWLMALMLGLYLSQPQHTFWFLNSVMRHFGSKFPDWDCGVLRDCSEGNNTFYLLCYWTSSLSVLDHPLSETGHYILVLLNAAIFTLLWSTCLKVRTLFSYKVWMEEPWLRLWIFWIPAPGH